MADSGTAVRLPHLASHFAHVVMFTDVGNAEFLRQQLLSGNTDFEYAFIDATTVLSVNHVLAAVFRAVNDMLHHRLKSRNVHSEIVFSLSPNNNIAESFRRFGITSKTTNLLAIKILPSSTSTAAASEHLQMAVQGTSLPFTDASIARFSDLALIRKMYKLNAGGGNSSTSTSSSSAAASPAINGTLSIEDEVRQAEAVVLGMMAIKGS